MKDAIIITDSTFELSDFKAYAKRLFEFKEANESKIEYYIPYEQESYFSISKDNSMFDLMEPYEKKIIASEFETFNIFASLFYDFRYVQSLVASIPSERKIFIDNDHGTIMRKEDFLSLNSYEEFIKGFE
ncbi:hypothetical protein [[Flexibacter] sp. ATCC 35208]|uniref:hypothetical protein n=1 Tax=[Flexibacter] sp. ATCC 35208 TaxID=1936242 RepID=UPI0009D5F9F6|nr:hypothetical protein [[Flexibacter] sp. ATCC 35208]OMP75968.1 hypothetical protein BW716_27530 [[Flexibacter] sp. ATCC 35208]